MKTLKFLSARFYPSKKWMTMANNKSFKIEHIDPLGQGVSKIGDKITFIPKTLPGEEGECIVHKSKKKIEFARIENPDKLTQVSPIRIAAECEHFDSCSGCHYQHTTYEEELILKKESLLWQLRPLQSQISDDLSETITSHGSSVRLGYRNRIQLHYNKKINKLGFIKSNDILEVPFCKVSHPLVTNKLQELYKDNNWLKLVQKEPNSGHIELYLQDKEVQVHVNKRYAHGGFSQVHSEMNIKMLELINDHLDKIDKGNSPVLDLFGGSGNLTKSVKNSKVYVVDATPFKFINVSEHQQYVEVNLYGKSALEELTKKVNQQIDIMLIDPPRSGMKNLDTFLNKYRPKHLIYVSCQLSSLIRDLGSSLHSYKISKIHLVDLFPSTYHFETVMFLEKIK